MTPLQPRIVSASASGDEVAIIADGVTALVINRSHALWFLSRLAMALARAA